MSAPTETPDDDGTVLAIGRRHRSAWDRFDALDKQRRGLPPDSPEAKAIDAFADRAAAERERLLDRVLSRRAETLADAAVMAAHGLHRADVLLECNLQWALDRGTLEERLGHMR
jgi:hypothetical protein